MNSLKAIFFAMTLMSFSFYAHAESGGGDVGSARNQQASFFVGGNASGYHISNQHKPMITSIQEAGFDPAKEIQICRVSTVRKNSFGAIKALDKTCSDNLNYQRPVILVQDAGDEKGSIALLTNANWRTPTLEKWITTYNGSQHHNGYMQDYGDSSQGHEFVMKSGNQDIRLPNYAQAVLNWKNGQLTGHSFLFSDFLVNDGDARSQQITCRVSIALDDCHVLKNVNFPLVK